MINKKTKQSMITWKLFSSVRFDEEPLNRALSDQGWALKIVPGPNYLKELREIMLPVDEQKQNTSASIAKFKATFNDFGQSHYQQYRPLNKEQLRDLIQMTPLMWHANERQIAEAMGLAGITLDLQILFGRKIRR